MAGRPKTRAQIAQAMALGGEARAMRAPRQPKVVTSIPKAAPRVAALPDASDAKFGDALAKAVAAPSGDMVTIFEELRIETMRFALEVMRMELDPDERGFAKLLGVKQQITTAVMTATTRIRPGDLREREDDGVGALLAKLRRGDVLTDDEPTAEDLLN